MGYIEIKGLRKIIKDIVILDNINLNIEKGKIYGFIGRNGSGKTMLFRAISGLIKPTEGSIKIDGEELNKDINFPKSIGIIIESPGFWGNYTAFENLKILADIKGVINDEEIIESLKKVGLLEKKDVKFKKFSLGMKQKLAIAQAIMEKPDILILDEPTNALDEDSCFKVREILMEEKKRGATILIASHNKEDIESLSDEKFKIDNGKIKYLGELKYEKNS